MQTTSGLFLNFFNLKKSYDTFYTAEYVDLMYLPPNIEIALFSLTFVKVIF